MYTIQDQLPVSLEQRSLFPPPISAIPVSETTTTRQQFPNVSSNDPSPVSHIPPPLIPSSRHERNQQQLHEPPQNSPHARPQSQPNAQPEHQTFSQSIPGQATPNLHHSPHGRVGISLALGGPAQDGRHIGKQDESRHDELVVGRGEGSAPDEIIVDGEGPGDGCYDDDVDSDGGEAVGYLLGCGVGCCCLRCCWSVWSLAG